MARRRISGEEPFGQPAATVIRSHALRLIQETDAAVARLADRNDVQALHDVRVALRRLRGWLRAFGDDLSVTGRQRRSLRKLAEATNTARDAEVSIEWLGVLEPRFDSRARPGIRSFTASLGAIRDENYAAVRRELPRKWRRLSRKLPHRLPADKKDHRLFQQAFAASLRTYQQGFEEALMHARRVPDALSMHRLRIAGKKVRYLLETVLPWHPQIDGTVQELKALHELAGSIQDLQRLLVLSEEAFHRQAGRRYHRLLLSYADPGARETSLRRPDLMPAVAPLLWICRAACLAQAERMAEFRKRYLSRKLPLCLTRLRALTRELSQPVTTA